MKPDNISGTPGGQLPAAMAAFAATLGIVSTFDETATTPNPSGFAKLEEFSNNVSFTTSVPSACVVIIS